MKKFLTIIALLMAFVTPSLADKTVYLDATPSGDVNWPSGARLALYMFNSSDNAWTDFELKAGETYIYQATVPDTYTTIICVRMNGGTTENNWNNKWNQTQDIPISNYTEVINVKITGWDAASVSGQVIPDATISTVQLFGSWNEWDSNSPINLTESSGSYTGTIDVSSFPSSQEFKLVVNGNWLGYGELTLVDEGNVVSQGSGTNFKLSTAYLTYTVTATWTPSPDATAGWTMTIAGEDERLVTEDWTCTAGSVEGAITYDNLPGQTAKVAIGKKEVEVTLTIQDNDFLFKGTKAGNTVTFLAGQSCQITYQGVQATVVNDNDFTFNYSEEGDNKKLTQVEPINLTITVGQLTPNATITGVVIESNPAPAFPGTVIWSSETPVEATWYSDPYDLKISADKFANVKVGDKIHVAVVDVPAGLPYAWSAQVMVKDGWWKDCEKAVNVGTGDVTIASFVITGDMLTRFKERGMIIAGQNFSTNKISIETISDVTGSDKSIWVGNASTPPVTIYPIHFQCANKWVWVGPETWDYDFEGIKAGDIIRVTATKNSGYWYQVRYSGTEEQGWAWQEFTDAVITDNDFGFDVTVGESMVSILKEREFILNFGNMTITQVEIITPNGDYYIINDLGQGWVVGDKMVEDNGVYSATIEDAAGKYFAIVPNTGLNAACDALVSWANVARPVSDGNFLVKFRNYAGTNNIIYTGNNVWAVEASNDADVTINFTPASNSFTLSCEKTITMAAGYATYSNDQKFQVTGAEAYKVTAANGTSATLTKIDVDDPVFAGGKYTKGTGIILKGESAVIKSVDADAEVTAPNDVNNLMVGSGDETYIISGYAQELGNYTPYILMDGSNGVGFYKFVITLDTTEDEKKLAPHKAFLAAPENLAPFLSFDDEGGTTGISNVNHNHNDNQWYDLSGRRVENPTKGLYIMNGKKVIIK